VSIVRALLGSFDLYGRDEAAPTSACSSSEWPQTIFSGQMSSSLDANTSRTVETMIQVAMPAGETLRSNPGL